MRISHRLLGLFIFFFFLIAGAAESSALKPIDIYYLDFTVSNKDDELVLRTLQYLKNHIKNTKINAFPVNLDQLNKKINEKTDAFFIASSGNYWEHHSQGPFCIATLTTPMAPEPNKGTAGAFIVHDSANIHSIDDLKGKRAALTNRRAFLNAQLALAEIGRAGYDPDNFFKSISETGRPMTKSLSMVADGKADVALVRAGLFESLKEHGDPIVRNLRVLPPPSKSSLLYLHSTETYPGWTFFAGTKADPEQVREIALQLLSIPPKDLDGGRWLYASELSKTDEVFKYLKTGPYSYLREWTLRRIWDNYKIWIVIAVMLLVFTVFHAWRNEILVKRRTAELLEALKKQKELSAKVRRTNSRLAEMEKVSIVGVTSSMVIHDLLQPLSVSSYLLVALKDRILNGSPREKLLEVELKLEKSLNRSVKMLGDIRKLVEHQNGKPELINLNEMVKRTISALVMNDQSNSSNVSFEIKGNESSTLLFDPFSMEMILLNLIKNAREAASVDESGKVCISWEELPQGLSMEISNTGPVITQARIDEFTNSPLKSDKKHGLGLGLLIVKTLLQKSGSVITFEAVKDGGLRVRVLFNNANQHSAV